jgi:hypothetical protein
VGVHSLTWRNCTAPSTSACLNSTNSAAALCGAPLRVELLCSVVALPAAMTDSATSVDSLVDGVGSDLELEGKLGTSPRIRGSSSRGLGTSEFCAPAGAPCGGHVLAGTLLADRSVMPVRVARSVNWSSRAAVSWSHSLERSWQACCSCSSFCASNRSASAKRSSSFSCCDSSSAAIAVAPHVTATIVIPRAPAAAALPVEAIGHNLSMDSPALRLPSNENDANSCRTPAFYVGDVDRCGYTSSASPAGAAR